MPHGGRHEELPPNEGATPATDAAPAPQGAAPATEGRRFGVDGGGKPPTDDVEKEFERLKGLGQTDIENMGADDPRGQNIGRGVERAAALHAVLGAPEDQISIDQKLRFLAQVNNAYATDAYRDAYYEPINYNSEQVYLLQRKLAAAGYLNVEGGQISGVKLGYYDAGTRKAMESLIADSRINKSSPAATLAERAGLQFTPDLKANPAAWRAAQEQAYVEAWQGTQPAPPGYFDDKQHMNPLEIKAYEQAKETWKATVGQKQASDLERRLSEWGGGQGG